MNTILTKNTRIGIIGGGLSGSTLGHILHKNQFTNVHIYEQLPAQPTSIHTIMKLQQSQETSKSSSKSSSSRSLSLYPLYSHREKAMYVSLYPTAVHNLRYALNLGTTQDLFSSNNHHKSHSTRNNTTHTPTTTINYPPPPLVHFALYHYAGIKNYRGETIQDFNFFQTKSGKRGLFDSKPLFQTSASASSTSTSRRSELTHYIGYDEYVKYMISTLPTDSIHYNHKLEAITCIYNEEYLESSQANNPHKSTNTSTSLIKPNTHPIRYKLHFTNGLTEECDILIAADGSFSPTLTAYENYKNEKDKKDGEDEKDSQDITSKQDKEEDKGVLKQSKQSKQSEELNNGSVTNTKTEMNAEMNAENNTQINNTTNNNTTNNRKINMKVYPDQLPNSPAPSNINFSTQPAIIFEGSIPESILNSLRSQSSTALQVSWKEIENFLANGEVYEYQADKRRFSVIKIGDRVYFKAQIVYNTYVQSYIQQFYAENPRSNRGGGSYEVGGTSTATSPSSAATSAATSATTPDLGSTSTPSRDRIKRNNPNNIEDRFDTSNMSNMSTSSSSSVSPPINPIVCEFERRDIRETLYEYSKQSKSKSFLFSTSTPSPTPTSTPTPTTSNQDINSTNNSMSTSISTLLSANERPRGRYLLKIPVNFQSLAQSFSSSSSSIWVSDFFKLCHRHLEQTQAEGRLTRLERFEHEHEKQSEEQKEKKEKKVDSIHTDTTTTTTTTTTATTAANTTTSTDIEDQEMYYTARVAYSSSWDISQYSIFSNKTTTNDTNAITTISNAPGLTAIGNAFYTTFEEGQIDSSMAIETSTMLGSIFNIIASNSEEYEKDDELEKSRITNSNANANANTNAHKYTKSQPIYKIVKEENPNSDIYGRIPASIGSAIHIYSLSATNRKNIIKNIIEPIVAESSNQTLFEKKLMPMISTLFSYVNREAYEKEFNTLYLYDGISNLLNNVYSYVGKYGNKTGGSGGGADADADAGVSGRKYHNK